MDSKTEEQVRKKRAKASSSPFNIYQKVLLLGGVLTIFLVVGIAPRMASILSVIVIGGIGVSLLLLSWFKSNKQKREMGKKDDLGEVETLSPPEEKAAEQGETAPKAEEKVVSTEEILPEEKERVDFEQKLPGEPENVVTLQRSPEGREKTDDPQEVPVQERDVDVQKMLLILEEKVANIQKMLLNLEDRVLQTEGAVRKLEEKAADMQEILLKPEEKVDMQMILSQLGERDEKRVEIG